MSRKEVFVYYTGCWSAAILAVVLIEAVKHG